MSSMLTIRIYNGLGTIILRQKETLEELILVNGINDVKENGHYGLNINTVINPKQRRNLLYLIGILHLIINYILASYHS